MEEQGTGGPTLMTSLAPRLGWLPIGFGLLLALIVAMTLVALIVGRGEPGQARVLETMPDSADIFVMDGPEPRSWTVTFLDESNATRGEIVPVRLRGDCGCEPSSDPGSPLFLVIGAVFFGLVFLASLRLARTTSQVRAAQLRSRAVADLGTPTTSVTVRPRFSPGTIRKVRLWFEVIETPTGRSLGWVDIRRARPGFDARSLGWLVGTPTVGADVALLTADGTALALAAAPLADESGPVAPWSPLVIDALGWDRPSPTAVPTVGGDGRLSVASTPSSSEGSSAVREVLRSRPPAKGLTGSRGRILGLYVVIMLAFFLVPFPWNMAVMVAVVAAVVLVATRQQGPMRAAVRADAPELARKDVNVASALLLALGGRPDPGAAADAPPAPPPPAAPGAAF